MIKRITILILAYMAFAMTAVNAWDRATHNRIVLTAIEYIKATGDTGNVFVYFSRSSMNPKLSELLGFGAENMDNREDTHLGNWLSRWNSHPSRDLLSTIPKAFDLEGIDINYTSFWHFYQIGQKDAFGNNNAGYHYKNTLAEKAEKAKAKDNTKELIYDIDYLTAYWLDDDSLLDYDSSYWDDSDNSDFDRVAKYYKKSGYSLNQTAYKNNFSNFRNMFLQPIDNAGDFWYEKSMDALLAWNNRSNYGSSLRTFKYPDNNGKLITKNYSGDKTYNNFFKDYAGALGHALHAVQDVASPFHLVNTLGYGHEGFEVWIKNNYLQPHATKNNVADVQYPNYANPRNYTYIPSDDMASANNKRVQQLIATLYKKGDSIKTVIAKTAASTNSYMISKGIDVFDETSGTKNLNSESNRKKHAKELLARAIAGTVFVLQNYFR